LGFLIKFREETIEDGFLLSKSERGGNVRLHFIFALQEILVEGTNHALHDGKVPLFYLVYLESALFFFFLTEFLLFFKILGLPILLPFLQAPILL
jgi:hypothetical protein